MILGNRQKILEHLQEQFGLEVDEIENMLPQFTGAVNNYRLDLLECVPTNDLDSITKKAHRLKGACLTLGLEDCVVLAKEMEQAARTNDLSYDYMGAMEKLDALILAI